jgi:hypothetical protein
MKKHKPSARDRFPNYQEWYFNFAPIEEKHFHIMLGFWAEFVDSE